MNQIIEKLTKLIDKIDNALFYEIDNQWIEDEIKLIRHEIAEVIEMGRKIDGGTKTGNSGENRP